jgi:hypothetical protein
MPGEIPAGGGKNKAKKNIWRVDRSVGTIYTHQTPQALKTVIHHSCG